MVALNYEQIYPVGGYSTDRSKVKLLADDANIYSRLDAGLLDDLSIAWLACERVALWVEIGKCILLRSSKCAALCITNKAKHDPITIIFMF